MDDEDDIDLLALLHLEFMLQAWMKLRYAGDDRAFRAKHPEEFFGFKAADVERFSLSKRGHSVRTEGTGLMWFILKDGRVFRSDGIEDEKDPALYTAAKLN